MEFELVNTNKYYRLVRGELVGGYTFKLNKRVYFIEVLPMNSFYSTNGMCSWLRYYHD